jgi:hypothetical protein
VEDEKASEALEDGSKAPKKYLWGYSKIQ